MLNWGIIGAGSIAKALSVGVKTSKTGRLAAVASRDKAKAEKFAADQGIPTAYGGYEELLADKTIDVIYVCTPHPLHALWTLRALEVGKHVLCEKPFAMNMWEAMKVFEVARAAGRLAMEAFMYRCHPQTQKLVELLRQRVIGDVRVIQGAFSFQAGFNPESRLFKNELAGGGIMDVGGYPVSIARLIAGVMMGKDFSDPIAVSGAARIGQTGVDEWAVGTLKFANDIVAQVAAGVLVQQENVVRIFGSEGRIILPNPWVANRGGADPGRIALQRNGQSPEEITIPADRSSFSYEVDALGEAVTSGQLSPAFPAATSEDTLGNLKVLDAWRAAVGCVYEQEKPHRFQPIGGRPLAVKATMPTARVPHLDKNVSRLVMGADNQTKIAHTSVMFDDWFERGGNAFDTAHIYGGGACEQMLGWWIKNRAVRDSVVVIGKGCHTPHNDPTSLTTQLGITLERLQTDHLDIYIMHRDNPQVPIGEFIDVLNQHVKAGRIRAFGGSNFDLSRIEEGNAYAKARGLQEFSLVSNNFSLARMVSPVWGGCIQSADRASRQWLIQRQIPLFAWSSQARGFFLDGNAAPNKKDDSELVRCWYSEDNFQRLSRAQELARKKGCQAINIALAYVLCQPFPTFPLIGPRTLMETRSSLHALEISLSPHELAWLNLEDDK